MKVLHVINSMVVGGAEMLLKDSIIYLKKTRPEIKHYLVTLYGNGKLYSELSGILDGYMDLDANRFNFLKKAITLNRYIKKNRIDIVHAHLYDAMILSRIATPSNKLNYTYHSGIYNPASSDYSPIRKLIDKFTYSRNHKAIYVSNAVKDDIENGVRIGNSTVIPNFTSDRFYRCYTLKPEKGLKLISIGNMKNLKNHGYSVEILKRLNNTDISLDIYGHGPLEAVISEQIQESGARVEIIKHQQISSELLNRYDALLMSSFQEGMSIAVIEAMTTGLPMFLSDIPSFRETAKDGAFYFDLNNIDDPVQCINDVLQSKEVLKEKSGKVYQYSLDYTLKAYTERLLSFYTK